MPAGEPDYTSPHASLHTQATPEDDENLRAVRRAASMARERALTLQKEAGARRDADVARHYKQVANECLRIERAVNLFRAHLFGEGEAKHWRLWPQELAAEIRTVDSCLQAPEIVPHVLRGLNGI